jgi:PhnB protein
MSVKAVPDGFHSITPFFSVNGASRLIEFLKAAFGATELMRIPGPDGGVMHAELKIGDSIVMIGEAMKDQPVMAASLYLYVPDTDATYRMALGAGGASLEEPADQFWGDRVASVKDPTGNAWWIATHVEDVDQEELERRIKALPPPSCSRMEQSEGAIA